ncbi:MAG: 4Fe-4S dicluster domain-containing protein [Oscillospiraceae bacterium]|nr:4Fe-4S dicluster domain-containing protein [Oscillospiraceae bacterium]MCL2249973.1 4Fe-4S dicluster domain-containing protein [Oscillospiraceae bacterium]
MLKLSLSKINELFALLSEQMELYLPICESGLTVFRKWTTGADVRLDILSTAMSPKNFFFPTAEDIASFKLTGKEIEIKESYANNKPFTIFGIRACDIVGIEILDKIFLSEPIDTFYKSRRENGIIISTACSAPEETCFCETFNINATEPKGGDINTCITNDFLFWNALTEKGQRLTEKVTGIFEATNDNDANLINEEQIKAKEILAKLPFADLKINAPDKQSQGSLRSLFCENSGVDPDGSQKSGANCPDSAGTSSKSLELFDSPQWDSLFATCLSCSTCTYICPTCHCYDIGDFDTGSEVRRFKCWDSCMNSDFTLMAHGNPRPGLKERFRQRYMHKLVYFPENNEGITACVGCGRCVRKCPISMNIVKVIKSLSETERNENNNV